MMVDQPFGDRPLPYPPNHLARILHTYIIDARMRHDPENIPGALEFENLPEIQQKILEHAARCLARAVLIGDAGRVAGEVHREGLT